VLSQHGERADRDKTSRRSTAQSVATPEPKMYTIIISPKVDLRRGNPITSESFDSTSGRLKGSWKITALGRMLLRYISHGEEDVSKNDEQTSENSEKN
jgi:hypothetical protein